MLLVTSIGDGSGPERTSVAVWHPVRKDIRRRLSVGRLREDHLVSQINGFDVCDDLGCLRKSAHKLRLGKFHV